MNTTFAPPRWNAADYARSSSTQQRWARELIAKLHLAGHEHVLDVGCGDGKVTAELAAAVSHGGSVHGVDYSFDMITHARAAFAAVPNLHFERMDARTLTLPAAHYDVVFSNAVLHWILDHRPVLRGIAHALKPGGRVLLQMGGQGNCAGILPAVNRVVSNSRWQRHFDNFTFPYGFYSPADYEPWLAEAGLQPIRVELIPKDMNHADRETLTAWFRTTWMPWTQCVPADQRDAFIDEVIDTYLSAHPPDESGRCHVEMIRLEVEATRPG